MVDRADDEVVTAWALAAGGGDRAALAAFVPRHPARCYRFVSHLAGPGQADDLAQETYLRALTALPRFAARSSARTWLLSIARRAAADAVRTAARRPRTSTVDDWDAVIGTAAIGMTHSAVDQGVVLRNLVRALAPERREAFVLTQLLGLSYAETALVCGCPIGTVRSRVSRARTELIHALNGESTDSRRAEDR